MKVNGFVNQSESGVPDFFERTDKSMFTTATMMSGSITGKWSISNNWRTEFVLHKMHEIFSDDVEFSELNYSRIMMEASFIGSFLRNLGPEWIIKLQEKLGSDELHEGYVNPVLDDDFFLSYQTVYDFVKEESLNLPERASYSRYLRIPDIWFSG